MRKVLKLLIVLGVLVGIYFVWPQPSLAASFLQLSPKEKVKAIGLYKVISDGKCAGDFEDGDVYTASSWGTIIEKYGTTFQVGRFVEEDGWYRDNNGKLYCSEALELLAGLFGFSPTDFLERVYEKKQAEAGTGIQQRRYQCLFNDLESTSGLHQKTDWITLPMASEQDIYDIQNNPPWNLDTAGGKILHSVILKISEVQTPFIAGTDAPLDDINRFIENYCRDAINGQKGAYPGLEPDGSVYGYEDVSSSDGSGGMQVYVKGSNFSSRLTEFFRPYFNDMNMREDVLVMAAPGGLLKALLVNEYLFNRDDDKNGCKAFTVHPEEMSDTNLLYDDAHNPNQQAGKLIVLSDGVISGLRENYFNWAKDKDANYYYANRTYSYQIFPDIKYTCEEMAVEYSRLMEGYAVFNYPINKAIIDLLHKDTDTAPAPEVPPTVDPDPATNEPVEGTTGESVCDVGILGWVVCPLVNLLASGADLFVSIIEGQLAVKPSYFNFDLADGTYRAWSAFRDIANIIFVIMLLIVIFSQITGIGISNYGIKKILPKLVMVAILVNVSYYICLMAVDLSNIIGHQSKVLLGGLVTSGSADNPIGNAFQSIGASALLDGVVLIAGVSALAIMGVSGIALGILVALISALFLFLILMIRQVAIILLVTTSAIAIVCLLLPNTERFFERWRKIFVAMLVVYPVVGLVTGAGDLAKNIIFSADTGLIMKTVANLLPVLPAFIVPTLVKGTLNQFGTLGAKLSGLTDRAKAGASNRFKNSTLGNALETQDRQRKLRRITNPDSIGNKWGSKFAGSKFARSKFGRMTGLSGFAQAQARRQGAAQHAEDKLEAENVAAAESAIINTDGYGTKSDSDLGNAMVEAMQSKDYTRAAAYANLLTAKGGPGIAAVRDAIVSAQKNGVDGAAISAMSGHIMKNHAPTYKTKDIETFMWAAGGGKGKLEGFAARDKSFGQKLSQEEITASSSKTLERLATAGALNKETVEKLLNNNILSGKLDGAQLEALRGFMGPATTTQQAAPASPHSGGSSVIWTGTEGEANAIIRESRNKR